MSDSSFKRWSRVIINVISVVYIVRGIWLMAA